MGRKDGLIELLIGSRKQPEAKTVHVQMGRTESRRKYHTEDSGVIFTGTYNDKLPHPSNMGRYEDMNRDPEVETAIMILTDMVAGVGGYFTMPEGTDPKHPNKKKADDWAESINLDEKIAEAVRTHFQNGFCPVERLPDGNLQMLPPETFYKWRNMKGKVYKYSQDIGGSEVATWKDNELDQITVFTYKETVKRPYGLALVDTVIDRVEARRDMAVDVPEVIHKYGFPFRVWIASTEEIGNVVYDNATNREVDEDIFLSNIPPGSLELKTETQDPRINFTQYIVHNDEQIAEGLFAPLLLYLRNATEASATKMLEAVEMRVQGIQRYWKRRIEAYWIKPITGEPVPRWNWGAPKTGLEDFSLDGIAALYTAGAITFDQSQDILRKMGVPLIDITKTDPNKPPAGTPPGPGGQPGAAPVLPRISADLTIGLGVIERSFKEKRLSFTETCEEGQRIIATHVERSRLESINRMSEALGQRIQTLSPESESHYTLLKNELFNQFREKIMPTGKKEIAGLRATEYRVTPIYG